MSGNVLLMCLVTRQIFAFTLFTSLCKKKKKKKKKKLQYVSLRTYLLLQISPIEM